MTGTPLAIKHGWLENEPCISDLPNQSSIHRKCSSAIFDETRGYLWIFCKKMAWDRDWIRA